MSEQSTLPEQVRGVRRHPWVRRAARGGYVVVGLLHLIIAWLAVRVAFGDGAGQDADQAGALQAIADGPGGGAVLWAAAVALALLVIWQGTGAVVGREEADGAEQVKFRIRAGGKALVHLALAVTTVTVLLGGRPSGDEDAEEGAGLLIGSVPGRVLLLAIGLGIVGFACYQVYVGVSRRFLRVLRDDMHDAWEPWVERAGSVGYPARGVALGVIGVLVCSAAVQGDSEEVGGLDAALGALVEQPYGPWLLTAVAFGFAAFGLFSFGRARYGVI